MAEIAGGQFPLHVTGASHRACTPVQRQVQYSAGRSPRCASLESLAMPDQMRAFAISLDREEPPPFAMPMLRAVWHGLREDWDKAHELAKAQDDEDSAWVHAWLHRIEGDLGNAEYWYRRARRQARSDDTRDEGVEIAQSLIRSITDN
jgi:hypothetical protein